MLYTCVDYAHHTVINTIWNDFDWCTCMHTICQCAHQVPRALSASLAPSYSYCRRQQTGRLLWRLPAASLGRFVTLLMNKIKLIIIIMLNHNKIRRQVGTMCFTSSLCTKRSVVLLESREDRERSDTWSIYTSRDPSQLSWKWNRGGRDENKDSDRDQP